MERKEQEEKQKTPILVHPVQFAMAEIKRQSLLHQFKNMRKDADKIQQKRKDIAEFAEKTSNGAVKAETLVSDFAKLDKIYSQGSNEAKSIQAKLKTVLGKKTLKEAQADEELSKEVTPLVNQLANIHRTNSAQALMATSMAAVKLYDQQGNITQNKKGGISAKGAAIIAVALAGVGVGVYVATQSGKNGGTTHYNSVDYAGSLVNNMLINVDGNSPYASNVDASSQEFLNLINSNDYKIAVIDIKNQGQAEIKSLQESINDQIVAEYQRIEELNTASGYREQSTFMGRNNFSRLVDSDYRPLESYVAYLTRYKNYLEAQEPEKMYEKFEADYYNQIPQNIKDLYSSYNIDLTMEKDQEILSWLGASVRTIDHYDINTGEITKTLVFDEHVPDGTTLDFLKEYYNIPAEIRNNSYDIYGRLTVSEEYSDYINILADTKYANNGLERYYNSINPSYANQIRQCVENIDALQADYITKTAQIQQNTNLEIANLQQTSLGLDTNNQILGSSMDAMGLPINNVPQTGEKTGIIQNFVDSVLGGINDAQDAIINVVDDITRNL